MPLPHALLGLIHCRPATGYDLKIAFKTSIHYFWDATLPQIYRTLNDMETKGWLKATVEHQEGKPSRKVYEITPSGAEELDQWLARPTEPPQHRLPILVKLFFGSRMERGKAADLIQKWRDIFVKDLEVYEKNVRPVMQYYAKLKGEPEDLLFWESTLDYGIRHAKMNVEWCNATLEALHLEAPGSATGPQKKKPEGGSEP